MGLPKAVYNGTCTRCEIFGPGRVTAYLREPGPLTAARFASEPVVLCRPCRLALQGKYRLDERHK